VSGTLLAAACGNSDSGSGDFNVSKDDTIAAEVPKAIADKGSLTVATDATYAPNEFVNTSSQQLEGMDIDLGHALGDVMGIKFNFVNAGFDSIIPGMQSGRYQIGMSSFTDTLEREQAVDFVTYFSAGTGFYTAKDGPTITGLDSLCGHSVGAEVSTTQLDDAKAQSQKCTSEGKSAVQVSAFPTQNAANLALSSGRVEVVMADSPVASYAVQQSDGKFKLSDAVYGTAPYGIAIARPQGTAPGQAPMTKVVLDALNKLKEDGVYDKIMQKWKLTSGEIDKFQINDGVE
jgi:polar amino acid transport system substrate-binding protein